MQFTLIDWVIMVTFFVFSMLIGVWSARQASKNYKAFFLADQNMSWWLLGISLVATTFSTDTPNLVTDLVRTQGAFGNWVWWAFLLTGMLTVFLYAKLWRRSGVMTDVEFYELRYSGPEAAFLRGFRAAYLGLLFNVFVMATVTLAAIKIGGVMMGWTPLQTVLIAASVTMIYSALGGLMGVLLTDLFQFIIAMVGSVLAAIYLINLPEVGGLSNLLSHPNVVPKMTFLPDPSTIGAGEILTIFLIPIAVQWWASYYPGAEPGGGSYVVQRMLSAKDEKNAVTATLLFQGMHYALRPWPWILVAFASLIIFPDVASIAAKYPHLDPKIVKNDLAYPAMMTFLPAGLIGMVVTSLAAAYMSTMSSQTNYGSSILVNDLYHRFINPNATDKDLVWMGRFSTVLLMVLSCTLALFLENALQAFDLILLIGAGTGLIYLLRWFWWRINAMTEIVAMIVSFIVALLLKFTALGTMVPDWSHLIVTVAFTSAAWLLTAFLSKPTSDEKLLSFYTKIKPSGPGWGPVAAKAQAAGLDISGVKNDFGIGLLCSVGGLMCIYGLLFATGFFLYGNIMAGLVWLLIAAAGILTIRKFWNQLSFE
ncbi:MAG: Na+:solute symporter [Bacteroidetes Order II. Incertae sedis bacterium]|nr:Na+:solute symporter [Bacteroidetes Order II. bacterium]